MFILILISYILYTVNAVVYYDSFHGNSITEGQWKEYVKYNRSYWCINEIEPCDPHEGRRLDASCNNLLFPSRGAAHTPSYRVLPAVYSKDFEPRLSKSGRTLPLPRRLRTSLLAEARISDQTFTQLVTHYLIFMASDITNLHDSVNYLLWTPHCCTDKGKTDYMCTPVEIPDDDPVHRFSNIRCLNMTRPYTFQSFGCLENGTSPERIITATPTLDLSTVYGSTTKEAMRARKFQGGLLRYEIEEGRIWPPSLSEKETRLICLLNRPPHEKRCHDVPTADVNTLTGMNLVTIWFWRYHNHIAKELGKINPNWDDDKLFYTARDVAIAVQTQIFYYELLPLLMGYDNLIKSGVISPTLEFRDVYKEFLSPQISMEFPFVMRWVHKMQESNMKMYDHQGNYMKQFPIMNLTLRTGYLAVDNNIDYITQGSFRQACAKVDDFVVDPEMAQVGVGPLQQAADITASDMSKDRLSYFPPYVKYVQHCFGKTVKTFDDLVDFIDPERIERLADLYEDVEDIDLLAAIWVEKTVDGGYVPLTFYCLVVEQLKRTVMSDRHWYERSKRPHAFTIDQLMEIRKVSIARILCDIGDSVTEIQKKAFQRSGPGNEMQNCKDIEKIDWTHWADNIVFDKF